MKTHKHKGTLVGHERCFNHCVNPGDCEPGAHGNVTYTVQCKCGVQREVNVNQGWVEYGPWKQTVNK